MGIEGVKHLGDALKTNKVNFFSNIFLYILFRIVIKHTSILAEWYPK